MGGSVSSVTQPPSAVMASTEKPASSMTPVAPPLTDSKGSSVPMTAETEPILAEPEDTGPGTFEDLHRKCKDLFPVPFEGGKLVVNKGLSNHFQISHTMTMSSLQPSGYKFGCTYVGTKTFGPAEAYPVMMGEIDPSGNVNANIIHHFTKALRCKFIAQIQNHKWVATQMSSDYRGKNYVASVTLGNPDLVNESGVMVSQYLQNITRNLALGAELLYQYGPTVPGNQIAIYTLAGRYTADKWQLSASLTPAAGGVHLCYYQKAADSVQIGVELEGSLRTQECTATVGYQIDLPKSNLTFRGQLDSNWCVGAVMEKKLPPLPFTFALSAFANHVKGAYRFGVGLVVG
jgi:mitochondrial import receptor subunit TOM40